MKKMEKEELQPCFDCLQRGVKTDFSDRIIFSYGVSDSPLPFGSCAVVQMSHGEASAHSQFIIEYMPRDDHDCLTKYVDDYVENHEGRKTHGVGNDTLSCEECNEASEHSIRTLRVLLNSSMVSNCKVAYGSSNCKHSSWLSCSRTITALAPVAQIGICSYSFFQDLVLKFVSGCLEDHILRSLNLLIEEKASGLDSVNFLRLVGLPSFYEDNIPGCLRHPNLAPIIGLLKTSECVNLVLPKSPYTLENILHFSPNALKSEWHIRFLLYQLLSALAYLHSMGFSHGNLCPSSVMLTSSCWSWLRLCDKSYLRSGVGSRDVECTDPAVSRIGCCMKGCDSYALYGDLKLSSSSDWHSHFDRWWRGELSNFEYLLFLNRVAGRRWGDHTFHTVMPWVINFSTKPDNDSDSGWRDLSKSKWRLAKGDEQLDFTFLSSEIPHHVSDECLSELAVCSYKARRLPLSVLRIAVRSVYEPNEYPSSMQRLYQWTPDECIPEFYCDAQIFHSLHSGMTDLAVPSWAGSPEEFIKLHRDALESHRVSSHIHHWIDITFGYKMSGQAAVSAKNVMLPSSDPTNPRAIGRRQLFTQPHPARRGSNWKSGNSVNEAIHPCQATEVHSQRSILPETSFLQELEEASAFSEHARHLSPVYYYHQEKQPKHISLVEDLECEGPKNSFFSQPDAAKSYKFPSNIDLNYVLEHIEAEEDGYAGYQELLLWCQKCSYSSLLPEDIAEDIFAIGCISAELYLRRPLFDSCSLAMYFDSGVLPGIVQELPLDARVLVEACIRKDWRRRPSAKHLLESPFFHATVKSSYLFLAPLQLLAKDESHLQYAANFARKGALKAMGTFAAEMCAPFCLTLVVIPLSDTEAEWAYILLKEFIKCLTVKAVKMLVLPAIRKILQSTGYSHLKVSILQDSFVREIWNHIGKQAYLETIHPLVISNLYISPHKSSASAASVLLIVSSEELGVPITVHQTILPLIHCFGKGLTSDGIDVLVRIGGLLGEDFAVRQMLPLLKNVVHSCADVSLNNKPEPVQSWNHMALTDCLMALDGLVAFLSSEVIVKELIVGGSCLHVMVLMQKNLELAVHQVAATTLLVICERIGPELTALHVLPQLKDLFAERAFSQEAANGSGNINRELKASHPKVDGDTQIENRMDLVLLLYPSFASLLGIEKLRQGCATWLLLEQSLLRCHNWKWESTGESSHSGAENIFIMRPTLSKGATSEYNPSKLLLNGVGWSIPQSQGVRGSRNLVPQRRFYDVNQTPVEKHERVSNLMKREPWFWFPSPVASWDGPDYLGRVGGLKDELPWKIRASVISSVRSHYGAVRSLAACQDEGTVFTAGTGPGFKGTVQKWDLTRISCVSGYYGHEEVVNDIRVLSSSGRIASCDGIIHVWNGGTGKLISVFAEPSIDSVHLSSSSSASKINADQSNMITSNSLSGGILTSTFDGSLYTCMQHLEFSDILVVGTGNASLRFIDIVKGQKLHLWKGDLVESGFPSLVSALCSCGSSQFQFDGASASPTWIAAGLSSGHCRLFDARSGNIISSWRAHDGYVTKLASPEDHLLVTSSLDKTLRIWDLRRNSTPQATVFKGHTDGVSGFSLWGQDIISISRNNIGLSSLSKSADEDGQHRVIPQKLYVAENGMRNLSVLSSISILPHSRLFLVGTEDGYLRICC